MMLQIHFDFYAKQTNVGYMLQVHGSDGNYMTFDIDNDGTASFAKGGGWVVPTVADEGFHKKFTYSINTWHTVAAVVTIADKKIDYYIDGEYLGTDIGNPAFGTGAFKFAGTFTDGGWVTKSADPDNQAVYFEFFVQDTLFF